MRTRALAGTLTLAILAAACASSEPEVRLGDGLATWWRADGTLVIALPLTVSEADATVSSVDDPPGFRVEAIAVDPEPDAAPTENPSGTQPAPFTLRADATHLVYVDLVVDDCDEIGQWTAADGLATFRVIESESLILRVNDGMEATVPVFPATHGGGLMEAVCA